MKQLFKNGKVGELSETVLSLCTQIAAETPVVDIKTEHLENDVLVLQFASAADGRGFSLGKILKRKLAPENQLIATGELIPDHLALAWECGFDSAVISEELWQRCGPENWVA